MVKVVVNRCFGGFGLSLKACEMLISKGWSTDQIDITDPSFPYISESRDPSFRTHPDVISIVETLGDKANGYCAELQIIEVPDDVDWYIHDYDGSEAINEKHRSW